jgi:hypothetical protein
VRRLKIRKDRSSLLDKSFHTWGIIRSCQMLPSATKEYNAMDFQTQDESGSKSNDSVLSGRGNFFLDSPK